MYTLDKIYDDLEFSKTDNNKIKNEELEPIQKVYVNLEQTEMLIFIGERVDRLNLLTFKLDGNLMEVDGEETIKQGNFCVSPDLNTIVYMDMKSFENSFQVDEDNVSEPKKIKLVVAKYKERKESSNSGNNSEKKEGESEMCYKIDESSSYSFKLPSETAIYDEYEKADKDEKEEIKLKIFEHINFKMNNPITDMKLVMNKDMKDIKCAAILFFTSELLLVGLNDEKNKNKSTRINITDKEKHVPALKMILSNFHTQLIVGTQFENLRVYTIEDDLKVKMDGFFDLEAEPKAMTISEDSKYIIIGFTATTSTKIYKTGDMKINDENKLDLFKTIKFEEKNKTKDEEREREKDENKLEEFEELKKKFKETHFNISHLEPLKYRMNELLDKAKISSVNFSINNILEQMNLETLEKREKEFRKHRNHKKIKRTEKEIKKIEEELKELEERLKNGELNEEKEKEIKDKKEELNVKIKNRKKKVETLESNNDSNETKTINPIDLLFFLVPIIEKLAICSSVGNNALRNFSNLSSKTKKYSIDYLVQETLNKKKTLEGEEIIEIETLDFLIRKDIKFYNQIIKSTFSGLKKEESNNDDSDDNNEEDKCNIRFIDYEFKKKNIVDDPKNEDLKNRKKKLIKVLLSIDDNDYNKDIKKKKIICLENLNLKIQSFLKIAKKNMKKIKKNKILVKIMRVKLMKKNI